MRIGITSSSFKRPKALNALLLGVLILPASLFGIVAWLDRISVLDQAALDIVATTRVLEENAHNVFDTHKLVADLVDERIRGMTWNEIATSESLHQYLTRIVHDFPKTKSLWLIDPTGALLSSSTAFPSPIHNLADRDYFIALRDADVGLFVGQRGRGAVIPDEMFSVARRRSSTTGHFDGIIVIAALPTYFTNFRKKVVPSDATLEFLARRDGTLIARRPETVPRPPILGPDTPFMRTLKNGDSGVYRAKSSFDSQERIVAYQKVSGYSVYVGVGFTVTEVLRIWYRHLLTYGAFFAIVTLGLASLAILVERGAAREAAALNHWREAAQRLTEEAEQRAEIEAKLRQAQKMEAFGQFAGGIAHDFNNILQVIIGALEVLRKRGAARDEPLWTLATESANRGKKMIESMLAFARQQPLHLEVFDLGVVVTGLDSLLRGALGSTINLTLVPSANPCLVRADRNQAELAILNLALNARDAMPDGGTLTVIVNNVRLNGQPAGLVGRFGTVTVRDTGIGMSPDLQARVFEPFFTTKGPSKGTGLGLSMVYGFAEQAHGTVAIDSMVGVGTTIVLYLPSGEGQIPGSAELENT